MRTNVVHQGHGFQRTLLISALSVLAESKQVDTQSTICLAIEEPELYQHPIQARLFAKVIRELASDEQRRIQVIYVTHSPTFIEAGHFLRSGASPGIKKATLLLPRLTWNASNSGLLVSPTREECEANLTQK